MATRSHSQCSHQKLHWKLESECWPYYYQFAMFSICLRRKLRWPQSPLTMATYMHCTSTHSSNHLPGHGPVPDIVFITIWIRCTSTHPSNHLLATGLVFIAIWFANIRDVCEKLSITHFTADCRSLTTNNLTQLKHHV